MATNKSINEAQAGERSEGDDRRIVALAAELAKNDLLIAEESDDDESERLYDLNWNIREEISALEAADDAGLRAKAYALYRVARGVPELALYEGAGSIHDLARSLLADIEAQRAAQAAGKRRDRPDPVFAAIERHRKAYDARNAALDVSANLPDDGSLKYEKADAVTGKKTDLLFACADELAGVEPTTLKGAAALARYVVGHHEEWQDVPERYFDVVAALANALERL